MDIFVDWKGQNVDDLATKLRKLNKEIELTMITNRGVKVWPEGFNETFCTDHWRCRFELPAEGVLMSKVIPELLHNAIEQQLDVIKTENLYEFGGKRGYSLGQRQ